MKVTGSDFDDTSTTNKVIVIKPHHLLDIFKLYGKGIENFIGSSNIEMGKKWYENIIFSFIYAIISMKVIY